ncbi:hypothetical protein FNV43_RR24705 [Rhamnella rubrinervis]|uniref:Cucumisin n=1 Tax=Rhamnella rubrinervis TaxID=2594499 RepID=A0A8K0GQY8_9ROSA|nr:hypothetical protein FNV43_RR24705 [Rhamnella rubrinervis]
MLKPHTTKSWDFIGFPQNVKRSTVESDIIVGVIDYGIWPESESFSDKGFGPPPAKWKGTCQVSADFKCNNKIIGAKYYRINMTFGETDLKSPRDSNGHGTHTASTIAGGVVSKASYAGFGTGTARGGVPSARIAVYKVCWSDGCDGASILAAFDDAIADGADIISLSLGQSPQDYFTSPISIGSFHAVKNGILTSAAAGNEGPRLANISSYEPWSLSVAASTINRRFLSKFRLGNNQIYEGIGINYMDLKNKSFPLINGASNCEPNLVDKKLVKGKIVYCENMSDIGQELVSAGAAGLIQKVQVLLEDVYGSSALPASYIDVHAASKVFNYLNSDSVSKQPTATIFRSYELNNKLAPYIPSFSSRGPNPITPNILKPDLAAPGVHILAAWTPDPHKGVKFLKFNIISGTSMSCPHATAAAAYIKSIHPTWSPAAIKSALMTTANPMRSSLNPEAEFAYGSGLINPLKAPYPGLVYDIDAIDYAKVLCGEGYDSNIVEQISGSEDFKCSKANSLAVADLNYPSFALSISLSETFSRVYRRTLTNVSSPKSTYKAKVVAPKGLEIIVEPSVLSFTSIGQKQSFTVKLTGKIDEFKASASLVWDDGTYQVKSPILVYVSII